MSDVDDVNQHGSASEWAFLCFSKLYLQQQKMVKSSNPVLLCLQIFQLFTGRSLLLYFLY